MMVRQFLLVALFGAMGAVARYGSGLALTHWLGERFAFATLAVNVLGCFLLAVLAHVGSVTELISPELRVALAVGFLGAFTTFSTFGYETMKFAEDGVWHLALGNVAANLLLGLAAVWGGFAVARFVFGGA
jgi:CrcB protein